MRDPVLLRAQAGPDPQAIEQFADEALALAWPQGGAKTVWLKPNLCSPASSGMGVVTEPVWIEALTTAIRRRAPGASIEVLETDNSDRSFEEVVSRLGYDRLCERLGIRLVNLVDEPALHVDWPGVPLAIPVPLRAFDDALFISIAQLKTHTYQRMTCVLKNQLGVLPVRDKRRLHPFLEEVIYVINRFMRPHLSIVDARVAMEGLGPIGGTPKHLGSLIAGTDPMTVDAYCARLMGLDPSRVPALRYALARDGDASLRGSPEPDDVSPFRFLASPLYHLIRWKIRVTRSTLRLERALKKTSSAPFVLGQRLVSRLPSKVRERVISIARGGGESARVR